MERPTFENAPKQYRVNLAEKTCTCRRFESQGFPCHHAINSIFTRRENAQDYTEQVFTLVEYTATYATPIYPPIPAVNLGETPEFEDSELGMHWLSGRAGSAVESEEEDASADELLPPDIRRQPGRPRKRRIRGHTEVEPKKKVRCGNCKQFCGHNARTCRNPPARA